MSESTLPTQDLVRAALTMALHSRVGRGKELSIDEFERLLEHQIPARTLECYRRGEALPGLVAFLLMADALGPEFVNEVLDVVGMTGAHRAGADEPSGNELLAHTAKVTARLADMMADGRLDHRERRELVPVLRRLQATLGSAIAALSVSAS